MPPRRCCCDNCIIAFDDFKRPDALTLGDAWADPLEEWGIFGESALSNTGGEAIAIFNLEHPTPSTSMVVAIETLDEEEDSDQEFWVLLNVLDANNYHVAKLKIGPPMEIELGRVNAGVYTSLAIAAVSGETGTSRRFGAAISPTEFCASASNTVLSLTFQDGPPSLISMGYQSGMGGKGEPRIDYFEFSHHRHTKAECLYCLCECDDDFYLAPTLTATLTGTGRMSGLSCEFDIEWDRLNLKWNGSASCCGVFEVDLFCPSSGALEDIHAIVQGCVDSDVSGTVGVDGYIAAGERYPRIPESECKPLYLLFGPFVVSSLDLSCGCGSPFGDEGEFILEITSG
jgi:hypothetical protein